MARQQQGMQRPKSRWSIKWSEKHIFKAEQEGDARGPQGKAGEGEPDIHHLTGWQSLHAYNIYVR